jgi:hypothetical protein
MAAGGSGSPWGAPSATRVLELGAFTRIHEEPADEKPSACWVLRTSERRQQTYDIFEGTEQIQQLVISRAISGMRIE